MKIYIKPDVEIVKFNISDIITESQPFAPFAMNAVDEQVYAEGDGYLMAPDVTE